MIVNTGLAIVTGRLKGTANEPSWVHWGTGTNAPQPTDTALQTPGTEARVSATTSQQTTTTTNDTYRLVATLTCNATPKAITEVGAFDASTSGNLFLRGTFSPINVVQNDAIQFTINVVVERKT